MIAKNSKTKAVPHVWTFLTNHSHVLICLASNADARLRDVANAVGITERAVQGIVSDLEQAGVITRSRDGRRNHYRIHPGCHLRHPVESQSRVADLLDMVGVTPRDSDGARPQEPVSSPDLEAFENLRLAEREKAD